MKPLPTAVLAAIVGVAVACGGHAPALTSAAASRLGTDIGAIRTAAGRGDRAAAAAALGQLRVDVVAEQSRGQITSARAQQLLADAADVEAALGSIPTTTTSTSTTTTSTPAPPPLRPHPADHPHRPGDG